MHLKLTLNGTAFTVSTVRSVASRRRRNYSAITTPNYLRVVTEFAEYFGSSSDLPRVTSAAPAA